ncbi:hypothetical protein LguiA_036011 [Lonicera macranthoides]
MNLSRWRKGVAMDSYGASRNKQIQSDDEFLRGPRKSKAFFNRQTRGKSDRALRDRDSSGNKESLSESVDHTLGDRDRGMPDSLESIQVLKE